MNRMTLRSLWMVVTSVVSVGFTSVSTATPYACSGTVSAVTVDPNGSVVASFAFTSPSVGAMNWETLCSVTAVTNNVPIDACKAIASVLTSAFYTKATVYVSFDNGTPNVCSMQGWTNLKNFGWYWGPALSN